MRRKKKLFSKEIIDEIEALIVPIENNMERTLT
jgi:hypothetical protein